MPNSATGEQGVRGQHALPNRSAYQSLDVPFPDTLSARILHGLRQEDDSAPRTGIELVFDQVTSDG